MRFSSAMDVGRATTYVQCEGVVCARFWTTRLELLLILSALLSALTGAVASGRAPEVRLHHAVASVRLVSTTAHIADARMAHRVPSPLPTRRDLASAPVIGAAVVIPPHRPIYLDRQRE